MGPEVGKTDLSVRAFVERAREELRLTPVTPLEAARHPIRTADINRPGLVLAGFFTNFPHDRIQILGKSEIAYLAMLPAPNRKEVLGGVCRFEVPCIIVTWDLDVPEGRRWKSSFSRSSS